MDLGLKDKVALVAASSRGIGRAVASALAAEGAHLVMCARGQAALDQAVADISRASNVRIVARAVDLSIMVEIEALAQAAIDAFGRVDILVTNVGGPPAGRFESHDRDAWQQAAHQNLDSVVELCRAVLPSMKENGWGRILNITSIAAKEPVDNLILSNTMRAAVTGFARTLANEVARYGITVNNVLPGYTRTERLESLAARQAEAQGKSTQDIIDGWASAIPMGRVGTPEEFAALVAFLASESASYITGTSIPVDGGRVRGLL